MTRSWPTLPTSQEPPSTLCSTLGGASSAMDNIQVIEDRGAVSHRRSVGRWACTGARAGTRRRPCSSACGPQGAPWSCSAAGTAPAPEHQLQSTRGQLLYGPQDPPPTCVPSPSLSPGPASRWWPVLSSSWSSCEGDTRQSALYAAAAR